MSDHNGLSEKDKATIRSLSDWLVKHDPDLTMSMALVEIILLWAKVRMVCRPQPMESCLRN